MIDEETSSSLSGVVLCPPYSYRKATNGSTPAARLAGSKQAASPVIITTQSTTPGRETLAMCDHPAIWPLDDRFSFILFLSFQIS
jgi:hypothetical protein